MLWVIPLSPQICNGQHAPLLWVIFTRPWWTTCPVILVVTGSTRMTGNDQHRAPKKPTLLHTPIFLRDTHTIPHMQYKSTVLGKRQWCLPSMSITLFHSPWAFTGLPQHCKLNMCTASSSTLNIGLVQQGPTPEYAWPAFRCVYWTLRCTIHCICRVWLQFVQVSNSRVGTLHKDAFKGEIVS